MVVLGAAHAGGAEASHGDGGGAARSGGDGGVSSTPAAGGGGSDPVSCRAERALPREPQLKKHMHRTVVR